MTEYNQTTTLSAILAASPCIYLEEKLLAGTGKEKADDTPVTIEMVLDISSYSYALWVLSRAMLDDRLARHFQAWCAEQVLHLFEAKRPNDMRVRDQIAMLRNDNATEEERRAASNAASAAAGDATHDAFMAATQDGAWDAVFAPHRDAACHAARAASWYEAKGAARAAAKAAELSAASDEAWKAAWDAQEKQLRKMIAQ